MVAIKRNYLMYVFVLSFNFVLQLLTGPRHLGKTVPPGLRVLREDGFSQIFSLTKVRADRAARPLIFK